MTVAQEHRFRFPQSPCLRVKAVLRSLIVLWSKESHIRASLKYICGNTRQVVTAGWVRQSTGLKCYLLASLAFAFKEVSGTAKPKNSKGFDLLVTSY